ncbi:hypothetical protein ETU09_10380 [Apibacter muscae]|uniref:Uncharacterized protein n=1 Tax=Apibacter muscae TaxID=2509004 RepID=A0A563D839_9FLAO|nr:hypothetical protein [Apibacter muscae]TWP26101.1 hypothetical protein ETU09_10380 [Apibacter muscae]
MNKQMDIDHIKKYWITQDNNKNYSQDELISMLNKTSRNTVKYIVAISIIEFAVMILSLIISLTTDRTIVFNSLDVNGQKTFIKEMQISDALTYLNIIISIFFIYNLYKSYKDINILSSTKELINKILGFRKRINTLLAINIILGFIILYYTSFYDFMHIIKSRHSYYEQGISKSLYIPFSSPKYIIIYIIICIIFIAILMVYYWLIYGILLKKLKKNLEEIKKLDIE